MESIVQKINLILNQHNIRNMNLLLAFSGGKDSSVLLHILTILSKENSLKITAIYVNHQLRKDSQAEEVFIKQILDGYGIPYIIKTIEKKEWLSRKQESIEMMARRIRYDYFKETAKNLNIDFIITAHHFQDKIESFFLNLLRAGGTETLQSIPYKYENIIRPMIDLTRQEIDDYIHDNSIQYYEDISNHEINYQRNRVRHLLIPILDQIQPHYIKSFQHIFNFLKEDIQFKSIEAKNKLKKITKHHCRNYYALNLKKFKKLPPALQKEIIKRMMKKMRILFMLNHHLLEQLSGPQDKYFYDNQYMTVKTKKDLLWFIKKDKSTQLTETIIIKSSLYNNKKIKVQPFSPECNITKNFTAQTGPDTFPLTVRQIKNTDKMSINHIHPKLISRILSEQGVPSQLYQETLIIEDSQQSIMGFIFDKKIFRVSKNFYITEKNQIGITIIFKK